MLSFIRKSHRLIGRRLPSSVSLLAFPSTESTIVLQSRSLWKTHKITERNADSNDKEIQFDELDPDKFGNIREKVRPTSVNVNYRQIPLKSERNVPEDKDNYGEMFIKRGKKKSPEAYRRMLVEYLHEKPFNLKKILDLHNEYIYEDRYIPERFWYTMMLEACSRTGHTPKAIELFREMKRYEFKPTKAAVTALLNSCANSSGSKKYSLEQAFKIRDELQLAGFEFNDINYNCLIKTFAMLGDHKTAYLTLEEMESKGHVPAPETYSALLMGAIGNKKSGLLPARELFIKLLKTGSTVKAKHFNLFLRAIRDCNVNPVALGKLCEPQRREKTLFLGPGDCDISKKDLKLLPSGVEKGSTTDVAIELSLDKNLPSLLTGTELERIVQIDLNSLRHAPNRFQLFGGIAQFEELMLNFGAKPDLKTISLLVDCFWVDEFYPKIQALLKHYKLKPDIMLYNIMLKKAAKRSHQEICKEILTAMTLDGIQPDIMTFGALTFQCCKKQLAQELLRDMSNIGVRPNSKILGSLFNIACNERDMDYILYLLDYCERKDHQITRMDVEQINLLMKYVKDLILESERSQTELPAHVPHNYEKLKIVFAETLRRTNIRPDYDLWKEFPERQIQKKGFNQFVKTMKAKTNLKLGKDPNQKDPHSYYDEID